MDEYGLSKGWVIYTKSKCPYCDKVKALLLNENPLIIDCDEFLQEPQKRLDFLDFIKKRVGREHNMFPIVFYNYMFIGGYIETDLYINSELYKSENF
jgi:glutaredoxin